MSTNQLYTIGHASRTVPELAELLRQNGVAKVIDVRTLPKSRANPQFNRDALQQELPAQHGIAYAWMGRELGGLRSRDKSSDLNAGWNDPAFRGYADYMQLPAFRSGLQQLMDTVKAEEGGVAIMCAETVYWQCHRALLSDALAARGWQVLHIIQGNKPPYPHRVTSFAKIEGERVTYPATPTSEGGQGQPSGSGAGRKSGSGKGGGAAADAKQPRIDTFFKKRAEPEAPPG